MAIEKTVIGRLMEVMEKIKKNGCKKIVDRWRIKEKGRIKKRERSGCDDEFVSEEDIG